MPMTSSWSAAATPACARRCRRASTARSVLVLERAPQDKRGGNTAFTGGGFRMVHHGVDDIKKVVPDLTEQEIANTDFGEYTAEQYLDDLGRITQYQSDPELAEMLVAPERRHGPLAAQARRALPAQLRAPGVQDRRHASSSSAAR